MLSELSFDDFFLLRTLLLQFEEGFVELSLLLSANNSDILCLDHHVCDLFLVHKLLLLTLVNFSF